jgi:NADH:ubiquinone oxidoreductase subunit F (NADH-binding)
VETYANVPPDHQQGRRLVQQHGHQAQQGDQSLLPVRQDQSTPAWWKCPWASTLREIVFDIGGGVPKNKKFKAVQTGGPSGGCIPERFLDLPVDFDEADQGRLHHGSGGMIVMDQDTCMVDRGPLFCRISGG